MGSIAEGYVVGVAQERDKEHEAWVKALLDSDDRFVEDLPVAEVRKLLRATRDVEDEFGLGPATAEEAALYHRAENGDSFTFPELMTPLPGCRSCLAAGGGALPLQPAKKGKSKHFAWRFVGRSIKRVAVQHRRCGASGHVDPCTVNHRPAGVAWSKANGLFNVGDSWFFSLLLLEEVTKVIQRTDCAPSAAVDLIVDRSIQFMRDMGHSEDIEDLSRDMASRKLYDAWYGYELALKRLSGEEDGYTICRLCGLLPAKTGSDGCAKTAIPLQQESLSGRLDYNPQPEDEALWTQSKLFYHCRRRLLRRITPGSYAALCGDPPIPVDLVPPIFMNPAYASDTLYNTEREKRKSRSEAEDLRRGLPEAPSSEVLARVAALVKLGQLDPVRLRDRGYNTAKDLDALLELAGAPPKVRTWKSGSKKTEWLLAAYETLWAGGSECHLFTISARGTGGTVTLCCPHGVVLTYKFIFSAESDRDHADLLRSLVIFPAVHWMDDSCGLVSHWVAAYKEEYEALFGANRGCPKEWKTGDDIDLTPVRRAVLASFQAGPQDVPQRRDRGGDEA